MFAFDSNIFCTLFDSNYLDKGLVLCDSLKENVIDYHIYILAMDDICYDILNKAEPSCSTIIKLDDFLKKENLCEIYSKRKHDEFCYTCTPHLIDYVITYFNEDHVTYIDSDMFFYDNPLFLLSNEKEYDVQIIPHGFGNGIIDRKSEQDSGKYCVEFNTFRNTQNSLNILKWWKEKCRESCDSSGENNLIHGDQKYLDSFENNPSVYILNNIGAGVAPWNVGHYKLLDVKNNKILIQRGNKKQNIIFYHFHNISYIEKRVVSISVFNRKIFIDKKLIGQLYYPYLNRLDEKKNMLLKKYNFYPFLKKQPSLKNKNKRSGHLLSLKTLKTHGCKYILFNLLLRAKIIITKKINKNKNIIKL